RFNGFNGSGRFNPVQSSFSPVLPTFGSWLPPGPLLCPVPGRTGRSGPVLTTLDILDSLPYNVGGF
ncbi:hypothetical protein A2U01_0073801, partial [Trifolium medium]|nr:hypothetical protein [Trifolium medium]